MQVTTIDDAAGVQTSDDTPTTILSLPLDEDNSMTAKIHVLAQRVSNRTTKSWDIFLCMKRVGPNSPQNVGSGILNIVSPQGDLGALSWSYDVVDDGSPGAAVNFRVIGQNNADIIWYARATGMAMRDDQTFV